jgi:hypothetical protein
MNPSPPKGKKPGRELTASASKSAIVRESEPGTEIVTRWEMVIPKGVRPGRIEAKNRPEELPGAPQRPALPAGEGNGE